MFEEGVTKITVDYGLNKRSSRRDLLVSSLVHTSVQKSPISVTPLRVKPRKRRL